MCVHWECAWCQCKYSSQKHHIQHYTKMPTALQKLHVCARECAWCQYQILLLEPPYPTLHKSAHRHFRNFMCVHRECAWCQYQILVLEPPYQTLHKYTHSSSETSCVSTENVRGASAKFWSQNHHIQHYTNTLRAVQKINVLPLGICMVIMLNICISTSISNSTQKRPQHFRNFMRVQWECAWCQYQILVLDPPYPTLHKYTHSNSETSCVCTGNVHGASAKFWSQNHHIQHYTKTPTDTSETSGVCTWNVHGASTKICSQNHHIQHYTNTPKAIQKLHACALGMCMVLVPNLELRTTIWNTTQIRAQQFSNLMCFHQECAWC